MTYRSLSLFFSLISLSLLSGGRLIAQQENAGMYMVRFYKAEQSVAQKYVSYMSAASHGKGIRKANDKRNDLLKSLTESIISVTEIPSFQNDSTLRIASIDYLRIMYNVLSEDYGKIVNLEEISEQSYDLMEAYMLAQEKANEKLEEAGTAREQVAKKFAADHQVNLVQEKGSLWEKMETIGKVNEYYNPIYLIFFKSSKQETYLNEAVEKKNINGIEQNKNALLKYSEEGLGVLDTMKAFQADNSLVIACRKALAFFKMEAGSKINVVTDFFIKSEEFEKMKKRVSSKSSKEEINKYNKAVNDINKSSKEYNQTIQSLNERRAEAYDGWNTTVTDFFDAHMPYAGS
jgi:hypothetical protein